VIAQAERQARASTWQAHAEAVDRAVSLIRAHFAEPDTLRRLSEVAWLSRFHLHRVFCEVTGVSPGRFLAAVRMEAAKRLLLDPRFRVMDVCYEVGYGSVGTFTTQFTALVGVQPRRFRQLATELAGLRVEPPPPRPAPGALTGTVAAEAGYSGWACLGLFASRIPQGVPAGCTVAAVPGPFAIDALGGRGMHLLAVAMPDAGRMIELLAPDPSRIRVGWLPPGRPLTNCRLSLRPLRHTDPPLVLAYPLLLATSPVNGG
jgi:AraC-like DNA-binding protein